MSFKKDDTVRIKPEENDQSHFNRKGKVKRIESQPPSAVCVVTGGQPMADLVNVLTGGTDLYEIIFETIDGEEDSKWYSEDQIEIATQH